MNPLLKKPSAWVPIAMSALAIILPFGYIAIFGVSREPVGDEGVAAHLWQLLMGLQFPIIGFFAIKYLPEAPRAALTVLAMQLAAGIIAASPVFILQL